MSGTVLVTGATGYVGGRLVPLLAAQGRKVRCLARQPELLAARAAGLAEVVAGDVLSPASLRPALEGVEAAYYLVHSMGAGPGFEHRDREAARSFGEAARAAGVSRIVYLGGLGEDREDLSPHLRSRHEVGDILRASGVPVVELRASIVIGAGSLSFEILRALVERLPVMVTPRWVRMEAQPIAVDDVLLYLTQALDVPLPGSLTVEIGGADVVTYAELLREYARQRGLRRLMVPVPVLTPRLSSLWLGLVTPVYARIGRSLIDSIRHSTVARDSQARALFSVRPIGVREAVRRALEEDQRLVATHWAGSVSSAGPAGETARWGGVRFGNRLVDRRTAAVRVPPERAFAPIQRIGGATGWYFGDVLWQARGLLDLLAGGAGMRRGRRHPVELAPGDALDCWRVLEIVPARRLRLAAEMRLPGRAWLEFEVTASEGGSLITQTATFDPLGLAGLLYWYLIWPLHELVFRGTLRGIARAV